VPADLAVGEPIAHIFGEHSRRGSAGSELREITEPGRILRPWSRRRLARTQVVGDAKTAISREENGDGD